MDYRYSVIRFVPSAAQGEFVNVAVVVLSSTEGEAVVRIAPSPSRAKYLAPNSVVKEFWEYLRDFKKDVERTAIGESSEDMTKWLKSLMTSDRGMMQFSGFAPMVAETTDDAAKIISKEFLGGYSRPRRSRKDTKLTTARKMRQAYRSVGLQSDRDLFERVTVSGQDHNQDFDFAVKNGQIVQLAQAWNFGVSDTKALMEHVKAWAFTVEDIRGSGGTGKYGSEEMHVSGNVEILSVYAEPTNAKGRDARDEALHAFDKVGAVGTPVQDVGDIAESAYQLIQ